MEVGQALSAMEAALPDSLAATYGDALVRLQDSGPPMPTALLHTQLDQSFPTGWRRLFSEFDERPVGQRASGRSTGPCWPTGRLRP